MQNVTLPGRSTRGRSRFAGCALAILLVCVVLAIVVGLYVIVEPPRPTLPLVVIAEPRTGDQVARGAPVVVSARAQDPERISKVEFWVNGQLIGTQLSTVPAGVTPFFASQVWRPSAPGGYTIMVRALDTQGYSGQSSIALLEATEKPALDPQANTQVIAQPGDTVASIARDNGTTPEEVRKRNPDLGTREPAPGASIMVPPVPESEPSDDAPPSGGASDAPVVGPPPAPPPPPPGGTAPTEPYIPPIFAGVGRLCFLVPSACTAPGLRPRIPGRLECVVSPRSCFPPPARCAAEGGCEPVPDVIGGPLADLCDFMPIIPGCSERAAPGGRMPTAPRNVAAHYSDCSVEIRWTDDATDELGYRVYRDTELIANMGPGATRAIDASVTPGAFRYSVRVFTATGINSSGETDRVHIPEDCRRALPTETLEIEALRMDVTGTFSGIYCFVALGGLPYERIPEVGMMTLRDGHTNIADYLGGAHKRRLSIPRAGGLEIIADCYGSSAGAASALPRYRVVLDEIYWNGGEITGNVTEGAQRLTVIYRVTRFAGETRAGTSMPLVVSTNPFLDVTIPAPFNLRSGDWATCTSLGNCAVEEGLGIQWDWIPRGATRSVDGFLVYYRIPDFGRIGDPARVSGRSQYHIAGFFDKSAPFATSEPCILTTRGGGIERRTVAETVYYSVQAFVDRGGTRYESPMSEELEVSSVGCPDYLEIELVDLRTGMVCDRLGCRAGNRGTNPVEAYGWFNINDARIAWNCPYCSDRHSPKYVQIRSNLLYSSWGDMSLNQRVPGYAETGYRYHNERIILPIRSPGNPVNFAFWFYDYDSPDDDEQWCTTATMSNPYVFAPQNATGVWGEEWSDYVISPHRAEDGECTVRLRVRRLPRR